MPLISLTLTVKKAKVAFSVLFKKSAKSSSLKVVVPALTHLVAQ